MQTEQELTTAVGIASDDDNSSGRLRAKKKLQEQSKKLQEQSKKLQEQSKKLQAKFTSSNPGLEGRELSLFTLVVLGCIVFLLYTIVQNIAGLLRAQNDPATSLSYETTLTYPSFALLVCPNFLVNQRYWAPGGKETLRIVPHLEIFQQRGKKRGGSSSNMFTSSEGNKLLGTEFPFIPLNETNIQTTTLVEPKPIDMAFYQKTAINCLALSPNGITNSIDSGNLRLSMDYVNQHLDQDQIATLTVGMYCMVSRDGGEFVRDNTYCPADTPLLISAFSTEEDDFDKQQDLVWNFKHPCRNSPPNFCTWWWCPFFLSFFFVLLLTLCVVHLLSHASSLPQALAANPAWEQQHRCRRSAKAFCPWRRRRRAHRLTICFRLKVRPSHTSRTNCSSSIPGAEKTTRPGKGSLKLQNRIDCSTTLLTLYSMILLLLLYYSTILTL
jgi:hypothetical protein